MEKKHQAPFRIALASVVLSAGLLLVGWYDYTSTRNELLTLLVDQAASMRQAVAAAASLGEAASAQTQAAMAARLLDNGRLLRMLDARGGLTQAQLDEVARANRLFRVTVLSATGERELSSGIGGPPTGSGRGLGPGAGGGRRAAAGAAGPAGPAWAWPGGQRGLDGARSPSACSTAARRKRSARCTARDGTAAGGSRLAFAAPGAAPSC